MQDDANNKNITTYNGIDFKNFVIVPIKVELKQCLILGLQARPPIAKILSFLGYSYKVYELLQTLSHSTRASILNAKGLQNFLVKFDVYPLVENAFNAGQLENA